MPLLNRVAVLAQANGQIVTFGHALLFGFAVAEEAVHLHRVRFVPIPGDQFTRVRVHDVGLWIVRRGGGQVGERQTITAVVGPLPACRSPTVMSHSGVVRGQSRHRSGER